MKKKKLKRCISTMLAALMLFASMPAPALALDIGDIGDIGKMGSTEFAYKQFVDSFVLLENPGNISEAAKMTSNLGSFFDRFGAAMSIVSGVIGILQMCGVIKDPTQEMVAQILEEVYRIEGQIKQIDGKLNDLHEEMVKIAASQKEIDRSTKATLMIQNWNAFKHYSERLDNLINEYQAKIDEGIVDWWSQDSHDGVKVLYTVIDGEPALTYSDASYGDVFPEKAGNGETVDKDQSFGIPAAYIPDTKAISFNINDYRTRFESAMSAKFIEAANAGELDASEVFYQSWNDLSDTEKSEKANTYAADILNTQLYHIACDVMTQNNQWVVSVTNAYKNYCDNVLEQDSGINAMLNAMYLSNGFEGEIRDDLDYFCNGMIVKAGFYGQFALTCACQDRYQTTKNREKVRDRFAETVLSLKEKKDDAITGFDNYCYITGTKVNYKTVTASSTMDFSYAGSYFAETKIGDWEIELPNMMNSVYFQVLYDQYGTTGKKNNTSFVSYLKNNGTGIPENYDGIIMSKYDGAKSFDLHDGLEMKVHNVMSGGSSFEPNKTYRINVGNDMKDKEFIVHDMITYEGIDMVSGALVQDNKAARAVFKHNLYLGMIYVTSVLCTDNVKETLNVTEKSVFEVYHNFKHTVELDVLELEPCKELNADDGSPEDPFFAFDHPVLTPGVSDQMGPQVQDKKTALTDVSLKSSSYVYTGEEIKPEITVKAGKKTVPASGYTVSYENNTELGYGTVTVTADGTKYSGMITKSFKIVPKGTTLKTVRKKGTKATVKWKKQSAKMPSDRIDGYQIRYSTKSSMKNAKTVTVKGYEKTSKKIKKLKKNKKYYFQIRTYMKVGEETIYSKWSGKKSAK